MFINEARVTVQKGDKVTEVRKENIDRFASLCSLRGVHAQIGVNVGTTIGYGELKIDVSVTLTCDQNEPAMDQAAKLAIETGHEFLNLGLVTHGLAEVKFDLATLLKTPSTAGPDRAAGLYTGGPMAHVGVNVGTTIGFGEVKFKSNVRLACDQNKVQLDGAGGLAIEKSNEYTNWGLAGYIVK
jgi:hypothetical protein